MVRGCPWGGGFSVRSEDISDTEGEVVSNAVVLGWGDDSGPGQCGLECGTRGALSKWVPI